MKGRNFALVEQIANKIRSVAMKKSFWMPVVLVAMSLLGCGKEISREFLDQSGGKLYERGEHTPYTGKVFNDRSFFLTHSVGSKVSCRSHLVDGVYDGSYLCKDENTGNTVIDAHMENGKLDGELKSYDYKTGKKIIDAEFKEGLLDGEVIVYLDGEKVCETQYKKGKMEGKHVCWGVALVSYTSRPFGSVNVIRVNSFDSSEKTADAIFENGKIKDGFSVFYLPQPPSFPVFFIKSKFHDGKKNGQQFVYIADGVKSIGKVLSASGEYNDGKESGTFTWYTNDGKSVCAEEKYKDGNSVSGFINSYYVDGTLAGKLNLAPLNSFFVKTGKEVTVTTENCDLKENKGDCSKKVTQWDNGVVLKSVTTAYTDNFKTISVVSTKELIKESVGKNFKDFGADLVDVKGACGWLGGGPSRMFAVKEFYFPTYLNSVLQKEHETYESSYVTYENNQPVQEEVCPYGIVHYSDGCFTRKIDVEENTGTDTGNGKVDNQNSPSTPTNDQSNILSSSEANGGALSNPVLSESLQIKSDKELSGVILPGPSFDCAKAATSIEKMICSDTYIGNLDGILSQNYKALFGDEYGFDDAGKKSTRNEQKAWMVKRNACATKECVIDAYKSRIDEICDITIVDGAYQCQSWRSIDEHMTQ
jgi:antitoxin component YwqK of YwqJK toxin-antitoxin module/uncharacterized protein YecT (DUF1311 family)